MYSHVRLVAAAALIGFGSIIVVGALVLVPPAVERALVTAAKSSHPPEVLAQGASSAVTVEVPAAPEQPPTGSEHSATVPQASTRQGDTAARERETPVAASGTAERHGAKAVIQAQARPPVPKKAIRRDKTAKRSTNDDKTAKRSTNDALRAVRRFGDTLHDIPVSAYAPDGKQRTIVIRPTSVQDVYYYSVPR